MKSLRRARRTASLVAAVLEDPGLSATICTAAGLLATQSASATSRKGCENCRAARPALQAIPPDVYVCGGHDANSFSVKNFDKFSFRTGSWEALTPMPTSRWGCMGACVGGYLYMLGGQNCFKLLTVAERFNLHAKTWEVLSPMQTTHYLGTATGNQGQVYIFGGHTARLASSERYDFRTHRWQVLPSMLTPRSRAVAVSSRSQIYIVGGDIDRQTPSSVTECFTLHTENQGSWSAMPAMPTARSQCTAAVFDQSLLVLGGAQSPSEELQIERMDLTTYVWESLRSVQLSSSPQVSAFTATRLPHGWDIYIFGGTATSHSGYIAASGRLCVGPCSSEWTTPWRSIKSHHQWREACCCVALRQ